MPRKQAPRQTRDQHNSENAQFDALVGKSFDIVRNIGDDPRLNNYFDEDEITGEMHSIMGYGFDEHDRKSHQYDVCTDILGLMTSLQETLDTVSGYYTQKEWKTKVHDLESELTSFVAILGRPVHISHTSPNIAGLIVDRVMEALKFQ
jgi:hypothetical protein